MGSPVLMAGSVTVLALLFYFWTGIQVGTMRGRHKILAPATVGHPEFERAFRVQMNTLEQLAVFLPLLWLAAIFPISWTWIAPLVGVVWVASRVLYGQAYMSDPDRRGPWVGIGALCNLVLLVLVVIGLAWAWMHGG
ncbi:MAG TPA: MAPEG family protein [Caulobacteraceae bacterium]|nr:MAPEG family protein [Caulobacteraceae bacterium]